MPNGRAAHPNSLELKALIKHPSHDKWKRMEGQGSEGKEKVSSSSERGNTSPLAAGCRVATVGQLLFAPWAWAYSTLHPFGVGK